MRAIRDKAGLEAGANIQAISLRLRHSRVNMTLDVYGHFTETGVRDQVFAGMVATGRQPTSRPYARSVNSNRRESICASIWTPNGPRSIMNRGNNPLRWCAYGY